MQQIKDLLNKILGMELFELMMDNSIDPVILLSHNYSVGDVSISSRVLKHWKQNDLLPVPIMENTQTPIEINDISTDNKKRKVRNKFDFFGLIYLYILQDLRGFGFSLKKLKRVKEFLYSKYNILEILDETPGPVIEFYEENGFDTDNLKKLLEFKAEIKQAANSAPEALINIPVIMILLLSIITAKSDMKLVVTIDGETSVDFVNKVGQTVGTWYNRQPHIVLPLYNYLYHFVSIKKYKKYYTMYRLLNDKEMYILDYVRNGMYKEIVIKNNSGGNIYMELTEELKMDNAARLQDILLKGQYQELTVKTANGDIRYSTLKTKKKL